MAGIAERRSLLEANSNWERRKSVNSLETPKTESVKDRLAALSKSSQNWQKKVKKDDDLPVSGRRLAARPPKYTGKENIDVEPEALSRGTRYGAVSKTAVLLNLDKGLESFFPLNTPTSSAEISIDIDPDCVKKTPMPVNCIWSAVRRALKNENFDIFFEIYRAEKARLDTPRRARPVAKGRQRCRDQRILAIDTKKHIEEDVRDLVKPVVFEDDGAPVAPSARAGLQAVEDYSQAKGHLKAVDEKSPYPPLMLIRVKGEKKVDVRLVAPVASSIHQAAVFILVTPDRLLKYEGEDSNILEKTKATQMCIEITTKSDLHCKAKKVETHSGNSATFFRFLKGSEPGEDNSSSEPFETVIARCNLVLRVTNDYKIETVVRGDRVRFHLLQPNDTLVFDFGSEIYVWSGRDARKTTGKYAVEYATQLKDQPVPQSAALFGETLEKGRAEWILFRRIMQGVQDTLFSSKFFDWKTNETKLYGSPMTPRMVFTGTPSGTPTSSRSNNEDAAIVANELRHSGHPEPKTTLEETDIPRNLKDVVTESLDFWVLDDELLSEIEPTTSLSSNKCYVIRWQYRIQISGVRRLRTGEESEKETGRERVAYFYWLGGRTTPKQQGVCALRLSHMDKEKKPHLRMVQGAESPLFLQLFKGKLVICDSSKSDSADFIVLGASASEGHAIQILGPPFRSHAVYVRVTHSNVELVAGVNCQSSVVSCGLGLAREIQRIYKRSGEVKCTVQGDDPSLAWINATGRTQCPRFFRVYETQVHELICSQYHKDLGFPIEQSRLTDTVIVDAGTCLWVWGESAASTFCLRVAENYWNGRKGSTTVILKGNEPNEFIALFPTWEKWPEGEQLSPSSPPRPLKDLMKERTQTYSLSALRSRTELPEGIDTRNLEQYLSDSDFDSVFHMSREEFDSLPSWKRIRMRKEAGLF